MDRDNSKRRTGSPGVPLTGAIALLLLVLCLAEGATGSCLSYGHSCWGAHGKRSGKPPVTAPDWFLAKLFRRMDTNGDLARPRQNLKLDDVNAIYQGEVPDDSPASNRLGSDEDMPLDLAPIRNPEAKPMLDDELLSKIKLWQIMREVSEEQ